MENLRFSRLLSRDVICDFSHAEGETEGGREQKRGLVRGGGVRGVHGINPRRPHKHGEEKSELSSQLSEPSGGQWYTSKVLSCTFSGTNMEGVPPGALPGLVPECNSGNMSGKVCPYDGAVLRRAPAGALGTRRGVEPDLIQHKKEQDVVQRTLSVDVVRYWIRESPFGGGETLGVWPHVITQEGDLATKFVDMGCDRKYRQVVTLANSGFRGGGQ